MKARISEFGHMAGDAQLYSGRAGSAVIVIAFLYAGRDVALQALGVIRRRVFHQRLVRIMARDAGDASVSLSCLPAAAVLQTVGCKADVQPPNPSRTIQEDILPSAVTGATKVERLNRVQVCRVQDRPQCELVISGFCRSDMGGTWPVTLLTSHTSNEVSRIELIFCRRGRRMTTETSASLIRPTPNAQSNTSEWDAASLLTVKMLFPPEVLI
jgi:hypothetical protein